MKKIDELKQLAAEISKPMRATEKRRQDINQYIQSLEAEKAVLEDSEDDTYINQVVDINNKIEQSKKMLQEQFPSRHTYKKTTEYYEQYNQLYQLYASELKKEINPNIKQIQKLAAEIQSLLEKNKKIEVNKYRELYSVVGSITSYIDNKYVGDFQSSLRRLDNISTSAVVSDQLRNLLKRL